MLNQVILVGRLTDNPQITIRDNGKKVTTIIVAVGRTFKNVDGLYDTDFIKCILWNNMAANTVDYCHKGDIVGIKGRIQTSTYETEEGLKKYSTEVIAEKVTFLTSKKEKEEKKSKKNQEVT